MQNPPPTTHTHNLQPLPQTPTTSNDKPPNTNQDKDQESTGGTIDQDANILKFRATLIFKSDLPRPKWESKSGIMAQLTKNFKLTKKKFAGPISVFLKNSREIVIKGERESDFLLFETSKSLWSSNIFDKVGIQACELERVYDNKPENMLIGITHERLSPEGEKWLKKETRIKHIRFRGGNRWDLRFEDHEARNNAMDTGYVQGGGVIFKLTEWTKQVNTSQCDKCSKWGHQGKECVTKKIVCKYCSVVDTHSSGNCNYINVPEEHKCPNCKEGGHHASEKMECLSFLNYYFNACVKENVQPEERFVKAKENLETKKKK